MTKGLPGTACANTLSEIENPLLLTAVQLAQKEHAKGHNGS